MPGQLIHTGRAIVNASKQQGKSMMQKFNHSSTVASPQPKNILNQMKDRTIATPAATGNTFKRMNAVGITERRNFTSKMSEKSPFAKRFTFSKSISGNTSSSKISEKSPFAKRFAFSKSISGNTLVATEEDLLKKASNQEAKKTTDKAFNQWKDLQEIKKFQNEKNEIDNVIKQLVQDYEKKYDGSRTNLAMEMMYK